MTGPWLVSYLVLWALVVAMVLLLIGVLRQIGLLQLQRAPQAGPAAGLPPLEDDGPRIGTRLPHLVAQTVNDFGTVSLADLPERTGVVLMCMSPLCETCQHVVEPLNALASDAAWGVQPLVIMRADEQACRAFLSVFPLHLPTVCDRDRTITMGLDVHRTPFGLHYDAHGLLVRKGLIEGPEDLLALLGDPSAPAAAQAHVFPQGATLHVPAPLGAAQR